MRQFGCQTQCYTLVWGQNPLRAAVAETNSSRARLEQIRLDILIGICFLGSISLRLCKNIFPQCLITMCKLVNNGKTAQLCCNLGDWLKWVLCMLCILCMLTVSEFTEKQTISVISELEFPVTFILLIIMIIIVYIIIIISCLQKDICMIIPIM